MVRENNPRRRRPFYGTSVVVCPAGPARAPPAGYFTHSFCHCHFYFAGVAGLAFLTPSCLGCDKESTEFRLPSTRSCDRMQPLENDRPSPASQSPASPFRAILDCHPGLCTDRSYAQRVGARRDRTPAFLGKSSARPRRYFGGQRKSLAA